MQKTIQDLSYRLASSLASVTAQLRAASECNVSARVIQEGFRNPFHREQLVLLQYGMPNPTLCWTREVFLQTAGQIKALARILVPARELHLVPWIRQLGSQPLGAVLFEAYNPERKNIYYEQVGFSSVQNQFSFKARTLAIDCGYRLRNNYWFRRSVLLLPGQHPVHCLVTECFFSQDS